MLDLLAALPSQQLFLHNSSSNIIGAAHVHFTWSPPFSSPEPVVSWSLGRLQIKPSGSGDKNGSPLPRTQMSLSRWKCARKGRREGDNRLRLNFACRPSCRLYPSHGTLRFITRRSSTLRKTKRLRRRLWSPWSLQSLKGCILPTMDSRWQHCLPNNVGSCCILVGSGGLHP